MSSMQDILQKVRRNLPQAVELPPLDGEWIRYVDPMAQFTQTVEQVGGRAESIRDFYELNGFIESLEVIKDAKKVCSLLPEVGRSDIQLNDVHRPHELEDVDVVIARGQFAVAENGAVWVTGADVKHRAVLFICQHLVLVVPASEIVHNMHEAYDRLTKDPVFATSCYGTFISGPSKTADIEQSLVIGAQGPRSLTVGIVETS